MRYFDATITVKKSQITLKQRLRLKSGEEVTDSVTSLLRLDPARKLAVERLHYWLTYTLEKLAQSGGAENPCKRDDLKAIGWLLFDLLLPATDGDELRGAFRELCRRFAAECAHSPAGELRLRLRLIFDNAPDGLDTLPWEFLYIPPDGVADDGYFFAGERTELILTRHVPESQWITDLPLLEEKLRLLVVVVTATGPGTGPVDVREVNGIIQQFESLEAAGRVTARVLRNPSYNDFAKALGGPADKRPHIIHYIGHGQEGELALCKEPADPDFDFEREKEPQLRWVEAEQIKDLFTNHKPRLVFLHACKGAASKSLKALDSTARKLLAARIPAVVAMQYSISNHDAGMFARSFYESLGNGATLEEAVKEGRLMLGEIYPRRAHPRFGTPVVYLQSREAIVIPFGGPPSAGDAAATPSPAAVSPTTSAPAPAPAPAGSAGRPGPAITPVPATAPVPAAAPATPTPATAPGANPADGLTA